MLLLLCYASHTQGEIVGKIVGVIFFALVLVLIVFIHKSAVTQWTEVTGYSFGDFYTHATGNDWWVYHRPRLIVAGVTVVAAVILKRLIWK